MKSDITRRHVLAGATAATLTSSVAVAAAAKPDPVLALYEAWRKAVDETERQIKAVDAAHDAFAEKYGSTSPRIQYGWRADHDTGRKIPLYFYSVFEIERMFGPQGHSFHTHPRVVERRQGYLARFEEAIKQWRQWYEAEGLDALDRSHEEAAKSESDACRALRETPATTPAGVALKFKAALFYTPAEFQGDVADGDTLAGEVFGSMLRDLENMRKLS